MNNMLRLIITHGNLADELHKVSHKFLPVPIPTFIYTNQKDSIEKIIGDASLKIKEHNPERIIVFVDLLGGSCWHAAMRLKKKYDYTSIITGVNIAALISFSTNYNRMNWEDLIKKIEEDSKKAIRAII